MSRISAATAAAARPRRPRPSAAPRPRRPRPRRRRPRPLPPPPGPRLPEPRDANARHQEVLHHRPADLGSPGHHGVGAGSAGRHPGRVRARLPVVRIAVRRRHPRLPLRPGRGGGAADGHFRRQPDRPHDGRPVGGPAGPHPVGALHLQLGQAGQRHGAGANGQAFRRAVLVQYPRAGAWTIAFVTGTPGGEVAEQLPGEHISVYVPTTPNPTSGFSSWCRAPRRSTCR